MQSVFYSREQGKNYCIRAKNTPDLHTESLFDLFNSFISTIHKCSYSIHKPLKYL